MSGKTTIILFVVVISLVSSATSDRICRSLGDRLRAVGSDHDDKITYGPGKSPDSSFADCQSRCLKRQRCTGAYFKYHLLWATCWLFDDGKHKPYHVEQDTGFPERTAICGEEQQIMEEYNQLQTFAN